MLDGWGRLYELGVSVVEKELGRGSDYGGIYGVFGVLVLKVGRYVNIIIGWGC